MTFPALPTAILTLESFLLKNETKNNNGFYSLTAKSDITTITTGGSILMNASTNFSVGCTSGIMSVNSGTSLNLKSKTLMTIVAETNIDIDAINIDMEAETLIDVTAPTVDINGSTAINLN